MALDGTLAGCSGICVPEADESEEVGSAPDDGDCANENVDTSVDEN